MHVLFCELSLFSQPKHFTSEIMFGPPGFAISLTERCNRCQHFFCRRSLFELLKDIAIANEKTNQQVPEIRFYLCSSRSTEIFVQLSFQHNCCELCLVAKNEIDLSRSQKWTNYVTKAPSTFFQMFMKSLIGLLAFVAWTIDGQNQGFTCTGTAAIANEICASQYLLWTLVWTTGCATGAFRTIVAFPKHVVKWPF